MNQGLIRLGNAAGTTLYDQDNNNANTDLQLTSGAFNSVPRVQKQNGFHAKSTATQAYGINFAAAGAQIAQNSTAIKNYATSNCQNKINYITLPSPCNNCNPTVAMVANKVNYVNLATAAELNNMINMGSVNLDNNGVKPTATSPLIFNVQAAGAITWTVPNLSSVSGSDGSYILWNFPNAPSISFSNNNSVYGTILAPLASITKNGGNNFEGQVLAAALTISTGEIHYQPFAAQLPLCNTALPLEALSLQVSRQSTYVHLSWHTQAASNIELHVERSFDGKLWSRVAEGVRDERYTDHTAPAAALFYRIRGLTPDGTTLYSNTARVDASFGSGIADISPNPFTDCITVQASAGTAHARLLDATGRVLAERKGVNAGVIAFESLADLAPGFYFVLIADAAGAHTVHKLVKK